MTTNATGVPWSPHDEHLRASTARLAGTLLEVRRLGRLLANADPIRQAAFAEVADLAVAEALYLLRLIRPKTGESPGQAPQGRRQ